MANAIARSYIAHTFELRYKASSGLSSFMEERVRKGAEMRSLSTGSMEAALASPQGESLRKLLEHLNDAEERFALVRDQYGANHPEYHKGAPQVAEIRQILEKTAENATGTEG